MRTSGKLPPARSTTSRTCAPSSQVSAFTLSSASNAGWIAASCIGFRRRSNSGAASHKYSTAGTAAIATNGKNSNTVKRCSPRLAASDTTIRFVDVPIVVAMPPISTA